MFGLKHSEHLDFRQTDGTHEEIACVTSIDHRFLKIQIIQSFCYFTFKNPSYKSVF